jgi:tetratricopeptide (TPR) repeat protein
MKRMKNHISILLFLWVLSGSAALGQAVDRFLLKAGMLSEKKHYAQALEAINNSESKQNKNYSRILAEIHLGLQNHQQASEIYGQLEENAPGTYQMELSKSYAIAGNMKKSMEHLNNYFSQKNKLPISKIINDEAFIKFKGTPEWENMWQKIDYTEAELKVNQVNSASNGGYNEDFRGVLDEALRKLPSNPELLYQQSKYYMDKKMFDAALKSINQSLTQRSSADKYHYQKAQILARNNKNKEALASINDAINKDPFNSQYYLFRIELNRKLGNTGAVSEDMKLMDFSLPNNADVQLALVQIEADKGNYLNAIDGLNSLIQENNTNMDLYLLRGKMSLKIQRLQNADEDFGMALDLNPADAEANLGKGIAKYQLDDLDAACYYWQKSANEGSREALEYLHKFCEKEK